MVNVSLSLDKTGALRACEAFGHAAAGKPGEDIVCAAVSVLVRTVFAVLSGKKGIVLRGGPGKRGEFALEVQAGAAAAAAESGASPGSSLCEDRSFLAAAGAFLAEGLGSVAAEYPQNCALTVKQDA